MSHHLDIEQAQEELQDKASELKEKAVGLKESAGEKAAQLKEKASEAMAQAQEKTDRSLHVMGEKMTKAAGLVREKTGMHAMADRLESGGQFLQENGVNEIKDHAADMIRSHPVEAMVVGMGIGILIGSLLSARRGR
jgi:ElaB/YqjD/DUF883 family membrane-anchored ribosome-binding protein